MVLGSAGYSLTVPRFFPFDAEAAASDNPVLSTVTGSDYRLIVVEAIKMLGGMERFVRPGSRVVVKPNIGWDRKPEQAANTHPVVVKTIVQLALDAGAKEVRVFDYTSNEKRRCYINSGIAEAIESLSSRQAKLVHIDQRKFVSVDIKRGKSLTRWDIYKDVLTADAYINVPVAKHHGLSRLTLGLKNSMGVIGGSRGRLHHDLGQKLADLATVVAPVLTVIDATRMLMDNGPQGGSLKDVRRQDTVIASADPVAADAFATALFGLQPQDISSTVAAYRMGLGQMDLAQVDIRKQSL
jgi:uncharacterized protein (DUF362 family)